MKNKKIWNAIVLLFLAYCSVAGNYINLDDEYLSNNAGLLGMIDFLICSIIMMLVPFILRLVNKKRFDSEKGKNICLWNSFVLFIISIISMIILKTSIIGGIGAIIYYFINKWLFVDESLTPNNEKTEKEDNENKNIDNIEKIYKDGIFNVQMGNYQQAENQLKKYIKDVEMLKKENNEEWYTFNNCVELLLFVKENDLSENQILDVDYNCSNAYFYLSMIYFENKNYEGAIEFLKKSLKWNPNNVNVLFEMAENYKASGNLKKYYSLTLELFDKIYTLKDLAHYYRNLGYYFIENKNWDLAKAMYLYSIKFENNSVALEELKYIFAKSKNEKIPLKEDLEEILKENRIPIYISKENLKSINGLYKKIIREKQENTSIGIFLKKLLEEINLK